MNKMTFANFISFWIVMAGFCPRLWNLLVWNRLVGHPFEVLKGRLPSLEGHPSLVLMVPLHQSFMRDHFLHQMMDLQVDHPSLAFQDQKDHHLPSKVRPFYLLLLVLLAHLVHLVHLAPIHPSSAFQDPTLQILHPA